MSSIIPKQPYRGKIFIYIFLRFVKNGLVLLPPYCYLLFLNEVINAKRFEMLWFVLALYMIIFMGKAIVSVFIKNIYNSIFPVMTIEIKEKMLGKYSSFDIDVLHGYTAGELKERLQKDTENVVLYQEKQLEIMITSVYILIIIGILLCMNWILAVISFALLPISFFITRFIKRKSNTQYKKRRQLSGKYNDFMIYNMYFWKGVKTNCQEEEQERQFDSLLKDMGDAFVKSHMFWFINRTFLAFKDVFLTKMGLYLLGGILVIKGLATVPILLTFMEYYADLVNRLLEISDIIVKIGEQEESIERVEAVMRKSQPKRPYKLDSFEKIEFQNVDFSYTKEQGVILRDFNMQLHRGESLAIVGESGCGKSTVIKIMAGYLVPERGDVLWNDHSVKEIDRTSIYAKVGFLMQESSLFNLTIRENLLFGKEDATEKEMIDACTKANIMEFINELSLGFETLIGENGIRLSGGQKQRLAIARLFLQNPEVIVLDEATSALDYQNEREILEKFIENNKDKTFIMVTHRGTSIKKCNSFVELIGAPSI